MLKKIEELQNKVAESRNEIISLKQKINELSIDNTLLQNCNKSCDKNFKVNNSNVESVSYANVAQKRNDEAILVVRPVNAGVTSQSNLDRNKNGNLNSVKASINVKELGVGVKSITEKNNGTE